eukprot:353069-Chlamydomonas_euryale.AAC.27
MGAAYGTAKSGEQAALEVAVPSCGGETGHVHYQPACVRMAKTSPLKMLRSQSPGNVSAPSGSIIASTCAGSSE